MNSKPRSDSLAEKISAEQKAQLIEWLTEHSFKEVLDLMAAPEPDGFGLTSSTSAIGRFAMDYSGEIQGLRAEKLDEKLVGHTIKNKRYLYAGLELDEACLMLMHEHLFAALDKPTHDSAELKRLGALFKTIRDLKKDRASRASVLMKAFTDFQDNIGIRALVAKAFNMTSGDELPCESEDGLREWLRRKRKTTPESKQVDS